MLLTEKQFNELVDEADGEFVRLVDSVRVALRPVVDGDWAWQLPSGRHVRVDDLEIEVIERIARSTGIDWMTVLRYPAQSPTMAWDVYLECCKFGGEEPMQRPTNAGAFLEFSTLVERIAHDRSTSHSEDGHPLADGASTD